MDNGVIHKIKYIHDTLAASEVSSGTPARYYAGNNSLELAVPGVRHRTILDKLNAMGMVTQHYSGTDIIIELSSISGETAVYYKEIHFRQRFNGGMTQAKHIAILDYDGGWLFHDREANETVINGTVVRGHYLVQNARAYYAFLNVLSGSDFTDYFNALNKELVLYSGAKGIKRIQVPDYLPALDPAADLGAVMPSFIRRMDSPDFRMYFKNQLFDFGGQSPPNELPEMLGSLKTIIQQADNNLQLYLKNFSFEQLKSSLDREKDRYFASLRDILGKNLNQIVAIPVSFAASVFATYRVNNTFVLAIILAAFLTYTAFTYYLQSLYLADIGEIEADFNRNFQTLAEKSGLAPGQLELERHKIQRRIHDIRRVIARYRLLLIGLSIVFCVFIVYQAVGIHMAVG
jgi:hypothetical protein